MEGEKTSFIRKYINHNPKHMMMLSSILGMTRSLLALPIQHPWDVLKVNCQINPQLKNEIEVIRHIKAERGLKGFYYGYSTNLTKQLFKSSYRYPLIAGLPRFYASMFGSKYEEHQYAMRLLTSLTVAFIEAGLFTPFERLQVFLMTSKFGNSNYRDFFNMIKNKARKELFRGYTPYVLKQCVSWTVFLQADQFYKNRMRSWFEIPDEKMVMGWKLACSSLLTSMTTIFSVMPFDNIKTYLQKHNIELKDGKRVESNSNNTISNAIKGIYERRGLRGFYIGWRIRIWVHFINASFTVALLEWLDNLSREVYD